MKFKPIGDRLLVLPTLPEEEVAGIILPPSAQERTNKGTVVAVSAGVPDSKGSVRELDVSEGDQVLYSPHGGVEVNIEGLDLLLLREADVLAKVTDKEG